MSEFKLGEDARRGTIGGVAAWMGWALLLGLLVMTAVHAIYVISARSIMVSGGLSWWVRVGGVGLAELFAAVTAVMLATNRLSASQKPAAMVVELTWVVFAGLNLVASFGIEAGEALPGFVHWWVAYGLPIAALLIGVEFYVMLRLDPSGRRTADDAELRERMVEQEHQARVEVLMSPEMATSLRQMQWQKLPETFGREMGLSDEQIESVTSQAPELLGENGRERVEGFQG